MVQLCCWVFTFVVFVGDGWMALVPVHLPHLRLLDLHHCTNVPVSYITEILASVPKLLLITSKGKYVGRLRDIQLEGVSCKVALDCDHDYGYLYDIIRQWDLDSYIRGKYIKRYQPVS
jgi:hypothetical protein